MSAFLPIASASPRRADPARKARFRLLETRRRLVGNEIAAIRRGAEREARFHALPSPVTTVKLSQQPRTESCVVPVDGLRRPGGSVVTRFPTAATPGADGSSD